MQILIALLVFLAVALAGYAVTAWLRVRKAAGDELTRRLNTVTGKKHVAVDLSVLKDQRLSSIALLNALLGRTPLVNPLVRMIRQAGLKQRVGEVLLYIPLLAVTTLLLNALLGGSRALGLLLAVVAGAIPLLVVQRIRRKRTWRFAEQLPEALDLMRSALQAGHGFAGAMTVAAETFPDPISHEFRCTVEEMRLGLPISNALYNLVERVPDRNLPILAVGVLVAQDSGGNMAEVLDNIAYTIRERFKLFREIRVMTAQGRLSGQVLTALPFFGGLFLYFFNPTYLRPLIEKPAGHYLIAYGLVSLLIGHLFIRRIVAIRV